MNYQLMNINIDKEALRDGVEKKKRRMRPG